ncbi:dehydrogenase [Micrococcales bacterium 31B]|nr:dehydrogenase [Micrococcales bacterium 31B]
MREQAFWVASPGVGEIRSMDVPEPGPGEVRVRTLVSGVSRGTETLVFSGRVPADQHDRMRAPFQRGEFSGPVSYGYLSVGRVEAGEPDLLGQTVFCLHPHHTAFVVPADAVVPVPAQVPAPRAVLAGAVETAVNALWDAGPRIGDRVAVVGAGMIGLAVARLLVGIPGIEVTVVDVDPSREPIARALGADFALPGAAPSGLDLTFHASATSTGLQTALDTLGPEGTVIDLSWYGDGDVSLRLGGTYHSSRLHIRSSQVGTIAPARAARRTFRDRLELALRLLDDPAFDLLLTGSSPFADLPDLLPRLASGEQPALCHTITYPPGA